MVEKFLANYTGHVVDDKLTALCILAGKSLAAVKRELDRERALTGSEPHQIKINLGGIKLFGKEVVFEWSPQAIMIFPLA